MLFRRFVTLLFVAFFASAPLFALSASPTVTAEEARAIAKEAYIYDYPLVDSYRIQYAYFVDKGDASYKAPWNQIKNIPAVYTPADTALQTPNSDTPYSFVGLDLRAEPIVTSIPAIEKERYFSIQFIDAYTFNFVYAGSRMTGNDAACFLIAGPNWKGEKPAGIKEVIRSETDFDMVLFRTQLFNPADLDNVKKIQSQYKVQPLSAFLGRPAPPAAPTINFSPATTAGLKEHFVEYLDAALQYVPETAVSKDIRAKLASTGIGPGKTFEFKDLSAEHKAVVMQGMKAGAEKLKDYLAHGGKDQNGWQVGAYLEEMRRSSTAIG